MKIATRTALAYALITAAILGLFSFIVYDIAEENRTEEFFDRLDYKVTWRAEFIFDAKQDSVSIKRLHEQNKHLLNEAEISVYDSEFNLVYTDNMPPFGDRDLLQKIKEKGKVRWSDNDLQFLGTTYHFNGQDFILIGRAFDVTGFLHVEIFKNKLITLYMISVFFIVFIGFIFSYYTFKPLKEIIQQTKDISEHNLHSRIVAPKAKDELYELVKVFNTTVNRLEKSFNNQKNFVTTISHEFRTPLSIMITELQLAKELNQTVEDYRKSIDNALEDANRASELSSALLNFARANYDRSQITIEPVRVDEVIIDSKMSLLNTNPNFSIKISYSEAAQLSPESMIMMGNAHLLQVAFGNLMENACKYSADHNCIVDLNAIENGIQLDFIDHGVGISEEDQQNIFKLFYRGENKSYNKGNGVGLSIVEQIVKLHNGIIQLTSKTGVGSTFTIVFLFK